MPSRYKFYKMDDIVYNYYKQETKRGKGCTKECVERKLLAMMLCASKVHDNGLGCKCYRFGKFNILVREDSDIIGMVYWNQNKVFRITEKQTQHLKNLYSILGLSYEGHEIINDIDYVKLEEYLEKYSLSNTEPFKNFFMWENSKNLIKK